MCADWSQIVMRPGEMSQQPGRLRPKRLKSDAFYQTPEVFAAVLDASFRIQNEQRRRRRRRTTRRRRRRRLEKLAAVQTSAVPTHWVQLRKPLSDSPNCFLSHTKHTRNKKKINFTLAAPPPGLEKKTATVNPQLSPLPV